MGSKPRPEYVTRLVLEKQRAIYWLCALLERDGPATRAAARQALADLDYDEPRIKALLLLGEPGQPRARERNGPWAPATASGKGRGRAPSGRRHGRQGLEVAPHASR